MYARYVYNYSLIRECPQSMSLIVENVFSLLNSLYLPFSENLMTIFILNIVFSGLSYCPIRRHVYLSSATFPHSLHYSLIENLKSKADQLRFYSQVYFGDSNTFHANFRISLTMSCKRSGLLWVKSGNTLR